MIAYKVVLVTNGLHIAVSEATMGANERAATLLAAMPTGVYSSILANRYQAAPGAASSTVVLSTGVSLLTLTVLLGWFL